MRRGRPPQVSRHGGRLGTRVKTPFSNPGRQSPDAPDGFYKGGLARPCPPLGTRSNTGFPWKTSCGSCSPTFTVNLLVIGLIASAISLSANTATWSRATVVEALLAYFLLFSIGVAYLQNFIMHIFFGGMTAGFIGWADSPFQKEVGFASVGFSLLGFLAFRGSFDMRLAAVIGPAAFLWGAAFVHLREMIATGNYAPGNAGPIFYTDIIIPIIGLTPAVAGAQSRSSGAHGTEWEAEE